LSMTMTTFWLGKSSIDWQKRCTLYQRCGSSAMIFICTT
jgi:hypothetical protein